VTISVHRAASPPRTSACCAGGKLQRWINDLVLGEDGMRKSFRLPFRELLVCEATRARVVWIDFIVVLGRPELVQVVPARRDHPVSLGGHSGDGARAAPCLDEDIIRDCGPCNFLPPDDGLAMSNDALAHAVEEIGLELP
jgi:hypothetical protein